VGFGKCCATLGEDVVLKVINGKPVVVSDTFDSNAYTCHNEYYGTKLTLDDFESYYPHRNRGEPN
jgi:hypothetical protein